MNRMEMEASIIAIVKNFKQREVRDWLYQQHKKRHFKLLDNEEMLSFLKFLRDQLQ